MTTIQLGIDGIADAEEIGRGGFGVVYRAMETDFGRPVAIKVLVGEFDERARSRFDRERLAMGSLSGHPNIVTIHRSGFTSSGQPFLLMEYLDGGSMADRLRQFGRLPWQDVATLGTQIGGALATAHEAGVLHRDVKPGNILLSGAGAAKLADFGIARLHGAPETRSSVITASIAHAPPEVIGGTRPDERADVYSLASTLFELVWGSPAFVGPDDESLVPMLSRIAVDAPPDLAAVGVPQPMIDVIAIAMAKDRERRFPSAAAFVSALDEAGRSADSDTTRTPAQPRSADATRAVAPLVTPPQEAAGSSSVATGGSSGGNAPRRPSSVTPPWKRGAVVAGLLIGLAAVVGVAAVAFRSGDDEQVAEQDPSSLLASESERSTSGSASPEGPEQTTPAETGPEETIPTETIPTETIPAETSPQETSPQETSPTPPTDASSPIASTRQAVSQTGAISVLVPEAWAGETSDEVSLLVATDLEAALADEWVKGAYLEAVRNTPEQNPGGFTPDVTLNQLIAESECTLRERGPYGDFSFVGSYAVLDQCGSSTLSTYFLVAAPADLSMVVLVAVQFESPEEDPIVELILSSAVWSIGGLP